jgi:transaldolase
VSTRLDQLPEAGVSIWLDTLSRTLLASGEFRDLIRDYRITGATSNPTIFARALAGSPLYDDQLRQLVADGVREPRELFFAVALEDVREAARLLRPVYDATGGQDGFVSFECTPDLADDADATIAQAAELWQRLGAANVMIKVPGTDAGLVAIEELIRIGINVNVTLLFSVERYEQVIDAYLRGLTERAKDDRPLDGVSSVASFFLSRIDTQVDRRLAPDSPLRGRVALACARVAYERYRTRFAGPRWQRLADLGAHPQRPLWASTGTKNPDYSDVLYVAGLAGRDVINTMPMATLHAFADHGQISDRLDGDAAAAERVLAELAGDGVDLAAISAELERDGIRSFCDSYRELLDDVQRKIAPIGAR